MQVRSSRLFVLDLHELVLCKLLLLGFMENETDESTRNLGQLAETKHYKSPVSEIQVVEDGSESDDFVRILSNSAEQNPHNKIFHKECADELLQQHISQRPSLKDLLCFPVEDESSVQNSTRDFG